MCTYVCIMGEMKIKNGERLRGIYMCVIRVYYGGEIKIKMGGGGGVCTFVCIVGEDKDKRCTWEDGKIKISVCVCVCLFT